jgi:hypothetical protein
MACIKQDIANSGLKSIQPAHGGNPGFRNRYTVAEMKAGEAGSPWIRQFGPLSWQEKI